MNEQIGKICRCDRCDNEIFLKYIKTEAFDGGFTKENFFEAYPSTWKWYSFNGKSHRFCDKCSSSLDAFLEDFMK